MGLPAARPPAQAPRSWSTIGPERSRIHRIAPGTCWGPTLQRLLMRPTMPGETSDRSRGVARTPPQPGGTASHSSLLTRSNVVFPTPKRTGAHSTLNANKRRHPALQVTQAASRTQHSLIWPPWKQLQRWRMQFLPQPAATPAMPSEGQSCRHGSSKIWSSPAKICPMSAKI